MHKGSDTCDALDGDTFATCDREPGHRGVHTGVNGTDRVQWAGDARRDREPSESELNVIAWREMLPPIGTSVIVYGVDGARFFAQGTPTLDAVIFGDEDVLAIRLRVDGALAVVPWRRVDALDWKLSS